MYEKERKNVLKFLKIQIEACDKIIEACEHWKVGYLRIAYENVKNVLLQYEEDVENYEENKKR